MTKNDGLAKVDVVVIGAGGSGLAAAVAAAEKGAAVIVLEKRRVSGGNSAMAGGLLAAETQLQKQNVVDVRRDELFKIAMDYAHWKINPRIIRAYVDKSADTIRWLEEKGVVFASLSTMYPNQHLRTLHLPSKGGSEIIQALRRRCKELGIRVLCQTPAAGISFKNRIWTVLAKSLEDKNEITIKAGCIVIASGGYGGSQKILKQYFPNYHENMFTVGLPHTGDGLLMAMAAGAATEGLGVVQLSGPGFHGASLVGVVAQEPGTLWINKYGERFADESIAFDISLRGNVVDRQPDKISYTLFDESIKQSLIESGLAQIPHGCRNLMPGTPLNDLDQSLQSEANRDRVKITQSLDEIAKWIGIDADVLKSTVDEYNTYCLKGHDNLFVKDPKYLLALKAPPYYAVRCYSCFTDTMGGIKVNDRMEVLGIQDRTISGLYAAGVCVGGWESETYCYLLSGSTLGFAYNSGRIAGENAAKYITANWSLKTTLGHP
jgi:fumarate reductase flavoprotein subunit